MLQVHEHPTVEEASTELLHFILDASNWIDLAALNSKPEGRPGQNPAYQRCVGNLRICASVDITATLDVYLRIAFRAPGLSPTKASDHLAEFLGERIPLTANSEWQVQVDSRNWIHFIRRYAGPALQA